ncbi:DUF4832 domain-containing protein [Paenibacillus nasutitermitis]|uniref:DUF4832 domain-containing protein n=1 Tax=Paenibacillus nasutitermitis TaxID=1652958 RepID=A0A916ZH16_9BACL|nr:DUF4832 domain-containing protein [Paenibacillus nasutitermitis]GGD97004.1 hypothetical protein GCM10010911_64680 [Paenibacillus nasutitermitis]
MDVVRGQTDVTAYPIEDTDRFLRNPAMGWAIYIDSFEKPFPDAEDYWRRQDPNIGMASLLYIRVPWSLMEPEEGCYAWQADDNYRRLIAMALERGLKLAFRVYMDSKDACRQATPQFVFDAGARGYVNETKQGMPFQTPYVLDAVFQAKLDRFVGAFAREYDKPGIVDFIDAQGLGWWGEMHNLNYLHGPQKKRAFQWIVRLYSGHFHHVLLGGQYGKGGFSYGLQEWAIREHGYVIRRDSFGSPIWFKEPDKRQIAKLWPSVPVFAENCYHTFAGRPEWYEGDGFQTLHDMMARVVQDAVDMHANTLDLRNPEDAELWMSTTPELVRDFALRCGYRFVLTEVTYPGEMAAGQEYVIRHTWKNAGVGKLPNDNRNWRNKYKLSFALLKRGDGTPVCRILADAEPAEWLQGVEYRYETLFACGDCPSDVYDLAVAIVNTEQRNEPEIRLALKGETLDRKWYIIGRTTII